MNRENIGDPQWELRKNDGDHSLYHVYGLLDNSIKENPKERYLDGADFAFEVRKVIKTIEHHGHSLNKELEHRCLFCGSGRYIVTDTPYDTMGEANYSAARYLGIQPLDHGMKNPDHLKLRVLECEWCGNIQLFRLNDKHWIT